ncbi:hypothetical protein FOA52_003321 [Chlamydomonas sp. UWO 241]|nr:hypothetical protein FOA52_003321 [Chlamydomonas sp. UWO 241]
MEAPVQTIFNATDLQAAQVPTLPVLEIALRTPPVMDGMNGQDSPMLPITGWSPLVTAVQQAMSGLHTQPELASQMVLAGHAPRPLV